MEGPQPVVLWVKVHISASFGPIKNNLKKSEFHTDTLYSDLYSNKQILHQAIVEKGFEHLEQHCYPQFDSPIPKSAVQKYQNCKRM